MAWTIETPIEMSTLIVMGQVRCCQTSQTLTEALGLTLSWAGKQMMPAQLFEPL